MEIVSYCPRCLRRASFLAKAAPAEIACDRCGDRREVRMTSSLQDQGIVDRCVLCGCGHLYVERDFNGAVGLGLIAAAVVASSVAWNRSHWWGTMAILGGTLLLDLAVWARTPPRTVCYQCVAMYRGAAPHPTHGPYDLGTAGRFADDYSKQRDRYRT